MLRTGNRISKVNGRRRRADRNGNCYEKMMKTLLLQNQQIIIQQQNMMFMVMKQYQTPTSSQSSSLNSNSASSTTNTMTTTAAAASHQHQQQQHLQHHSLHHQQQPHQSIHQQQQLQTNSQYHHQQQQQQQQQIHHDEQSLQSTHQLYSQAATPSSQHHPQQTTIHHQDHQTTDHQLEQVCSQLQESLGNYLTPAASEQDPINDDRPDEDDLVALLEGDGLLRNNLLYNPQTDIGSVTPYKNQQQQQQTPSYYSSGCESLTTPRVEQQRQPTNISQNVVKNLADSFKSPSKPKINVQILSGSATGSMKNSKAKIIQRMNISEFLRHVHPETDEPQKNATQ